MDKVAVRWATPGLTPERRELSLSLLSPAELSRSADDTFLQGRLMLRELVAELDSVLPSSVQIEAQCQDCGGPHGQPQVLGSRVRVSVANCLAGIVVVATRDHAIGVDVEVIAGPTSRVEAIGAVTGIASLEHWTRVEAVLKADGRGLRVDPRSVEIRGQDATIAGRGIRYRLHRLDLGATLVGSVAVAELPATPA